MQTQGVLCFLFLFVIGLSQLVTSYDFIVVGSGPGGGPLAARLALQRFSVLLLEAGGDHFDPTMRVPLTFTGSWLDNNVSWSFYVKHYSNHTQAVRDPKYVTDKGGILYPRASGLGGCSLHHVLNFVYPANEDWDGIAQLVDDPSWSSENMRKYFEMVEDCRAIPPPASEQDYLDNRHGYGGYIPQEFADYSAIGETLDYNVYDTVTSFPGNAGYPKLANGDFNSWQNNGKQGWGYCPQDTRNGQRYGLYQYLKKIQADYPQYLTIKTDALVSRVLFEGKRAIGVEYLQGTQLFAASANYNPSASFTTEKAYADKEVILSGGTYNSPQLLMLSGVGPQADLKALGIPVVLNLPGVGKNMQDRYEVGLNYQLPSPNPGFSTCPFTLDQNDPCYQRLIQVGDNFYGTNSIVYYSNFQSSVSPFNDLVLFTAMGYFEGYFPGMGVAGNTFGPHSVAALVLKAWTNNTAGTIKLTSKDPRQMPLIEFHYFSEGNDSEGRDLQAVYEGIAEIRRVFSQPAATNLFQGEIGPFANVTTKDQIIQTIRDTAWGHHACCTNKIGPSRDPMAVVDGNFRVHGLTGLRVVDASVFPKIPGYFPLAALYMMSEKAAAVIAEEYATSSSAAFACFSINFPLLIFSSLGSLLVLLF